MGLGSHTCAQSLGDFESKLKIKNTERSNVLVITRNVVTEIMMMIMRRCHSGILCDSEVHSGEIWVDFFSENDAASVPYLWCTEIWLLP